MVEHSAVNRRVASSNLARGAKFSFFLNYLQTAIFPSSAANCHENVTVLAFRTAACLSSPLLASPAQAFLTGSGASFRGLSGAWRSVRRAFLSDNRLLQVNQRRRKYPLHAGIGLSPSGVRSATGRFALRPFAYTTVAIQVFGGSGGRL